jgi:hypothetical protein
VFAHICSGSGQADVDITDSVDDFVKDVMHGIAENTESQRKAREELQAAGSDLLAALEQPLEQRMQEGANNGAYERRQSAPLRVRSRSFLTDCA